MPDYEINETQETPLRQESDSVSSTPAPASNGHQAQISQLFAQVDRQVKNGSKANKAAYNSLSALKIISNVLGGLVHHAEGMTEEELDQRSNDILQHYANQSKKLHEKLGLPDERYVYESITGSLARLISQHYRAVGAKALEMDWADALSSIDELDGVWEEEKFPESEGTLTSRRSMAMMNALAPVISAYQRFNFFHPESEPVLQRLGDLMWKAVDDALADNPVAKFMGQDEVEMLRKNLLLRAGELVSDVWLASAKPAIAQAREMPTEQRREIQANGFPLEDIENQFLSQFQIIRQSLDISLSVHTGSAMDDSEDQDLASSPTQ